MSQNWPIFVISLDDAEDRRETLTKALRGFGLEYSIVSAIDGRAGLPSEFSTLVDRDCAHKNLGREMTDPEFACALSHVKAYRLLIESNFAGAIVFEDDATVGSSFRKFYYSGAYAGYNLLQLDYGYARVWKFGLGRKLISPGLFSERLLFNAGLANAYAISRAGAEFIVKHALPISLPADWPCDLKPINPHIVVPRIAGHPTSVEIEKSSHLERARKIAIAASSERDQGNKMEVRWLGRSTRAHNPMPASFDYFSRALSRPIFPD